MITFLKQILLPLAIISTIAAGFFLFGVITLLRAKNDPLKTAKGNKILIYTISGFFIVLFAILIFFLISNFLGGEKFLEPEVITNPDEFPPAPPSTGEFPPAPPQ